MHHPTVRIAHTMAFVIVEHWPEGLVGMEINAEIKYWCNVIYYVTSSNENMFYSKCQTTE